MPARWWPSSKDNFRKRAGGASSYTQVFAQRPLVPTEGISGVAPKLHKFVRAMRPFGEGEARGALALACDSA